MNKSLFTKEMDSCVLRMYTEGHQFPDIMDVLIREYGYPGVISTIQNRCTDLRKENGIPIRKYRLPLRRKPKTDTKDTDIDGPWISPIGEFLIKKILEERFIR